MDKFLFKPVNSASLSVYRILFGILNLVGLARFWYLGWIERAFTGPQFLFKYWGFEWIHLWPGDGIYIHFSVLMGVCICLSLGLFTRLMSLLFFLGFTYIELLDLSNYLNHYYLISLLAFINIFLPLNARWSLDNLFGLSERREFIPAWTLNFPRAQLATLYFFAGVAKFGTDWLLHAEPLNIWLTSNTQLPILGSLMGLVWVHYIFSWAGFLFDISIPFWMMYPRTRPYAYVVILFFHFMTYMLFPIGMFPLIMVVSALIFFSPEWPLKLAAFFKGSQFLVPKAPSKLFIPRGAGWVTAGLALYFLVQWTMPWRHFLYPGDVLWSEEGMRYSWKVMIREKNSDINFRVQDRNTGRTWDLSPSQYLARHQEAEMSGTPDMMVQFAHFIRDRYKEDGFDVAVFADTMVSFNGRPAQPLVDPHQDLTQVEDGLFPKKWILPAPQTAPRILSSSPKWVAEKRP